MNKKIFSLEDMGEEYLKGAKRVIAFLREEGIICKIEDNCGECKKVDKFFNKLKLDALVVKRDES